MNWQDYIHVDPKIMVGKPVIKDTRITVELILRKLAAGKPMEQILEAHPRLKEVHIYAALSLALAHMEHEVVYPIAA